MQINRDTRWERILVARDDKQEGEMCNVDAT